MDRKIFLRSITKNCETLSKQNHTKVQETLDFKFTQPRQTFSFKPPISIEGSWMVGLTCLGVYKSIFSIGVESNKFQLYTDRFHEFSFTDLKDEDAEIVGF